MNCRFLHHMEYTPKKFAFDGGRRKLNGFAGRCRRNGCTFRATVLEPPTRDIRNRHIRVSADSLYAIFTRLTSHQTAPGPSDRDKGSPYTTAGVSLSTDAPVPLKGA